MADIQTPTASAEKHLAKQAPGSPSSPTRPPEGAGGGREGGVFTHYKPDQGKLTRMGTFVGCMALIAWGAKFLYDQLEGFAVDVEGGWGLIISTCVPLAFLVIVGATAWWVSFSNRKSSDFMIATEGEMKKVSWSTRREVLGSTKVVIVVTFLLAAMLFMVDIVFQQLFTSIGVLQTG